MNDRKDIPPGPPKAEAQRPAQPAPRPIPQQAVQPPAQVKLIPAASGGLGHGGTVFRPISTHGTAPAAPQPQTAASAPKPVAPVAAVAAVPKQSGPVAIAPKRSAPAPVAAPSVAPKVHGAEAKTEKPAKPLPATAKSLTFNPLAVNPWIKGFRTNAWLDAYPKHAAYSDGMRAAFEAGAILFRGVDRLAQAIVAFAGEQMASSAAAAEEFGNCRSFEALVARQSSFARANFDRATAAADKLTQMSVALAEEVCEPFADEVDAAANRIIETLAR